MHYKIDWTSLSLEGNLFCFILNLRAISKYNPQWAYIRRGFLMEDFLCYEFEGLICEILGYLSHCFMDELPPIYPQSLKLIPFTHSIIRIPDEFVVFSCPSI